MVLRRRKRMRLISNRFGSPDCPLVARLLHTEPFITNFRSGASALRGHGAASQEVVNECCSSARSSSDEASQHLREPRRCIQSREDNEGHGGSVEPARMRPMPFGKDPLLP